MNIETDNLGVDETSVLEFLKNWPDVFVAGMEIARRADGKARFLKDPHWAGHALSQLMELNVIESNGNGRYRLKCRSTVMCGSQRRFIAPHLLEILEKSGRNFYLSA